MFDCPWKEALRGIHRAGSLGRRTYWKPKKKQSDTLDHHDTCVGAHSFNLANSVGLLANAPNAEGPELAARPPTSGVLTLKNRDA